MFSGSYVKNINRTDILPPMTVKKAVKESPAWQKAVMDAFEYIGHEQFIENSKFWDYYRMVDGKMSYQELKQAVPHLEKLSDLLDGAGIPAFLKHYDILGGIIRDIVGKYVELQDKFHVIDTGEIANNEYLRYRDEEIQKQLDELINNEVAQFLAKNNLTEDGQQFESEGQRQAFLQQLEEAKAKATPKDTLASSKSKFKTIGMLWGEATMDYDRERFNMLEKEQTELRDKLLTGRCFREYKIGYDSYYIVTWSAKNTFFSKEVDAKYAQDGEYVGRYHIMTPTEVIKKHGLHIPTNIQRELLGGNKDWKDFVGHGEVLGGLDDAVGINHNKPTWVPFAGAEDYNFYLGIQDEFNIPMGESVWFNKDGSQSSKDRYLPRYHQNVSLGFHSQYAAVLRDDFTHRRDLCQVTEVYFIAQELWGIITYRSPSGLIVKEEVTEDILEEFLRENNIKQDFKSTMVDVMLNPGELNQSEPGIIQWLWRPVCFEGVKINSPNLKKPFIPYCRKMAHQIKGDSEFDIKLPVAGYIGAAYAPKILPYQAGFNITMNQVYNLLEKEIGIFFLLDVSLIPSEIDGWGDAQEAMIEMRNVAKDIGILPVQTSGDMQKNQNHFNQFTTHNLTYAGQIQYRIQLADKYKALAYETLGANPQAALQPSKYETAEGVRLGQENSTTQLAEIFQEFSNYNRSAWELHLSVAQFCQSNKKDLSVMYTKSDASIKYLQLSDPKFPLRRLGLLPSKDSKKRKELETFKQALINNNTTGSDFLEFGRLLSSDAMSEAIEIAAEGARKREEQATLAHERDRQLLADKAAFEEQKDKAAHDRVMEKAEADNKTKIVVGQLQAEGRAADKQADAASFSNIEETAKNALLENKIEKDHEIKSRQLDLQETKHRDDAALNMAKLRGQVEDMRNKIALKDKEVVIAAMNKN